jgi:hypothetical protein
VAYPGIFSGEEESNNFSWGQRADGTGSGGGSTLIRGSALLANEWSPYSYYVVMDVVSTELDIWLGFVKTSEFQGVGGWTPNPPRYATAYLSSPWRVKPSKSIHDLFTKAQTSWFLLVCLSVLSELFSELSVAFVRLSYTCHIVTAPLTFCQGWHSFPLSQGGVSPLLRVNVVFL